MAKKLFVSCISGFLIHSVLKSQTTVISEMAQFGPMQGAWEHAKCNMMDSTKLLTASCGLHVTAACKLLIRLAFGVRLVGAAP